jgi:molybdopterin-guanine dinucleotide biosynthesis protein A
LIQVDVIIPAGGKINPSFARVAGTDNKALIKLDGKTVLEGTVDCLRELSGVRKVVVIGSEDVKKAVGDRVDEVLPEQKTGPQNIFSGLRWLTNSYDPAPHVMIVTSDLPFISAQVIESFLDLCPKDKDFCVPLISKDSFADTFPGTDATFVTLRDGTWTTGCAYLATARGLFTAIEHIERVFKNRKSKFGMARILGPKFVYGYLTHKITVTDVENKVKEILKCSGVAVPGAPPELAFDIDYIEDYHYALQTLKLKKGSVAHV